MKKYLQVVPLPKKAIYKKGGIWITFRHAEEGLTFSENNNLKGFSIDKGKTPVEAQIKKKNKVFIPMPYKPNLFITHGNLLPLRI